ncbi:hypothetical protein ACLOJK_036028 [Asimina triloba]
MSPSYRRFPKRKSGIRKGLHVYSSALNAFFTVEVFVFFLISGIFPRQSDECHLEILIARVGRAELQAVEGMNGAQTQTPPATLSFPVRPSFSNTSKSPFSPEKRGGEKKKKDRHSHSILTRGEEKRKNERRQQFDCCSRNMKAETSLSSRFARWIKAPMRVLCRARDIYVRSMTDCASRIDYGAAAIGCPAAFVHTLPRSYTINSNSMLRRSEDDEVRELLRAVTSAHDSKKKKQTTTTTTTPPKSKGVVVNSVSMGIIGRIDEDRPCYFPNDFKVGTAKPSSYSRSKSFAAAATSRRPRRNGSFS